MNLSVVALFFCRPTPLSFAYIQNHTPPKDVTPCARADLT